MDRLIKIIPSEYAGRGINGDFEYMVNQPEYAKTLFVFNDNEEQFDAFVRGEQSGFTRGCGNAAIRPLRKLQPPRAAGIPTGKHGVGYADLDPATKAKLDQALKVIQDLLNTGNYDTLVFSRDKHGAFLGTGIFKVGLKVKTYIYDQLFNMK